MNLSKQVIFLGNRDDVNELYQAMDIFVLPSFFEGIPVVGIEAQYAKLPCVFSKGVPIEAKISDSARFFELGKGDKAWADILFEQSRTIRDKSKILTNEYDIAYSGHCLFDFYTKELYRCM